ncbi:MAG: WYL domain-containing protein [Erysipelotrichaceae bacterium]|nr:WYL domain-containing protein [Erysipelotrichaceae bacterium]
MEEKIRVNLPKRTHDLLLKDTENFEFFKKDGTLNKNAFINRLILNYHLDYAKKQKEMLGIITSSISELDDDPFLLEEAGYRILNRLNLNQYGTDENSEVHISFRPVRDSSNTIEFIESHELRGSSRSNYYRMLFDSYCSLPQDKRERIIFRDIVEPIEEAIAEDRQIYLLSKNNYLLGRPGLILNPYSLSLTREELYNYLLAEISDVGAVRTTRLCRIRNIRILPEKRVFTDTVKEKLKKMVFNGPQYPYRDEEDEPIRVRFTEEGLRMFKVYYLHRPVPRSIEGNIYTFDCSHMQALTYFSRFGDNALILEPNKLSMDMLNYYRCAEEKYEELVQ